MPTTTTTTRPPVPTPTLIGLGEREAAAVVQKAQSQVPPQGYSSFASRKACNGNVDRTRFGQVYAQDPQPGSPLTSGQPVTVDVYDSCTAVPNVVGMPASRAETALKERSLASARRDGSCVPGAAGGLVTAIDPSPTRRCRSAPPSR